MSSPISAVNVSNVRAVAWLGVKVHVLSAAPPEPVLPPSMNENGTMSSSYAMPTSGAVANGIVASRPICVACVMLLRVPRLAASWKLRMRSIWSRPVPSGYICRVVATALPAVVSAPSEKIVKGWMPSAMTLLLGGCRYGSRWTGWLRRLERHEASRDEQLGAVPLDVRALGADTRDVLGSRLRNGVDMKKRRVGRRSGGRHGLAPQAVKVRPSTKWTTTANSMPRYSVSA